jgi:arylsulfatase A
MGHHTTHANCRIDTGQSATFRVEDHVRRLIAVTVLCGLALTSPHAQAPERPNIVLIITDDVGYGDIGSYGAPDIKTPNIDSLAKAGTRFTQFYANASSCTPTRAGLISGRYQQRYSMERPLGSASSPDGGLGLAATGHSLPQLLKSHGYATALIGKWHLGYQPQYSPLRHGFDSFFGFKSGYIDYYQHTDSSGARDLFQDDEPVRADGYMTDLITQRSVGFIAEHAKSPFFLEVAYNAAHWPYQVPDHPSTAIRNSAHIMPFDENTDTRESYVKIMERADKGVGEIIAELDRRGLASNTLVIFTNDNGGEWLSRNAPLFNRKFTLYEGGIRVPAIMRWPGRVPAGAVSTQVGITMDLSATILAAAGASVPADAKLEGIDLLPLLRPGVKPMPRTLFWRVTTVGLNQRAVRDGDWKLLIDGNVRLLLFDVRKDLSERNDVAVSNTAVVRRLHQALLAWEKDVDLEAKQRTSASPGAHQAVPDRK